MDISNITYGGLDFNEVTNYKFIKDIIINKIIFLDNDIESIYKISIDVKNDYKGSKNILSGINEENNKCHGILGDFTLNIKLLIEYTNSDKLLGIKKFNFIETKYISLPFEINNNEIKGKVRNIYICRTEENELYLSIYYVLII